MTAKAQAKPAPKPSFAPVGPNLLRRKCACGGTPGPTGECSKCRAKRMRGAPAGLPPVPPVVGEVLASPGRPLDPPHRTRMESRFGHDFAGVRVHTDQKAARSAREIGAAAYAFGRSIVFGEGQYSPGTASGGYLLAHELTHILQQRAPGSPPSSSAPPSSGSMVLGAPADRSEREADRVAREVSRPSAHASRESAVAAPAHVRGAMAGRGEPGRYREALRGFRRGHDEGTLENYGAALGERAGGAGLSGGVSISAEASPLRQVRRFTRAPREAFTTGTALATTYGDLTFTRYDKTDANPPATPRYSVNVELRFLPKTTVPCTDVAFMQSMQTLDAAGNSQQNTVNSEQDARQTPLAWSIDRVAGAPSPFYITGRDPVSGGTVDVPGWGRAGSGGATPSAASLIDQPSWNRANDANFESCVVCRSGTNRGQVYGCATWGYTADAAGKVTLKPRTFRQMPSDRFEEARAAWNTWRSTVPAATRPEEAPALSSP
jgi:hypothetical protein